MQNQKINELPANAMCAGSGLDVADVIANYLMQVKHGIRKPVSVDSKSQQSTVSITCSNKPDRGNEVIPDDGNKVFIQSKL
jgi:hypothetical protein